MPTEERRSGAGRRLLSNLAVLVVSIVVTIIGVEVVLHVFKDSHDIVKRRHALLPHIWGPGEALPWIPEAGASGRQRDGYGEIDCEYRINSLGFRGDEIDHRKPPGTARILLLGDSVTVGWGVAQDETYAAKLERFLNETDAESDTLGGAAGRPPHEVARELPPCQVLNCGWASWHTTDGAYAFLRQRAGELDPDLVVLGFFLNDVAGLKPSWWRPPGAALPETLRPDPSYRDQRQQPLRIFDRVRIFLGHRSYLYNLIRQRWAGEVRTLSRGSDLFTLEHALNGEYPDSAVMLFMEEYPTEVLDLLDLTERLFVGMDELCAEHGAQFAVAIIPADFQVLEWKRVRFGILPVVFHDQPYVERKAQKVIAGICERNDIPVVDLLPGFLEQATDEHFFKWDPHPTAEGHTIIAQEIAEFIRSEGLLPAGGADG